MVLVVPLTVRMPVSEGVAFFQGPDQQGAKEVLHFLELSLGEGRLSPLFCHFCFLGGHEQAANSCITL